MATVVTAARRRQRAGAGSAGERTELSGGLALALQRTVGTGVLWGLPFIVRVIVRGPGVYLPGLDRTHVARSARRPLEESLYRVEAWVQGPFEVEAGHGTTIVQRTFRPADGPDVTFILSTSRQAGAIYGAGPGLPFLGSGNALAPGAPGAPGVAGGAGVLRAQVDRRGDDARLIYPARGGERGLIDGGTRRWDRSRSAPPRAGGTTTVGWR